PRCRPSGRVAGRHSFVVLHAVLDGADEQTGVGAGHQLADVVVDRTGKAEQVTTAQVTVRVDRSGGVQHVVGSDGAAVLEALVRVHDTGQFYAQVGDQGLETAHHRDHREGGWRHQRLRGLDRRRVAEGDDEL